MKHIRGLWMGHSMVHGVGSPGSGGPRGYVNPAIYGPGLPYRVSFVGSQHDPDPALAAQLGGHEGHDGWRISDALAALPGILAATPFDVCLMMLGTIEVVTSPEARAAAPGQLATLLDAFPPEVWVIVGTIPTVAPPGFYDPSGPSYVNSFNASLRACVNARRDADRNFLLCESGAAIGGQLFDGIHPNDGGYGAGGGGMGNTYRVVFERVVSVLARPQ